MRKVTVTYRFDNRGCVPMIRLCGKWLKTAGFEEGNLVHVDVADGRLTLTLASLKLTEPAGESSR